MRNFSAFSSNKDAASKSDEQELAEAKKTIKEELFGFMSDVVQSVIAFEFSASSGVSTTDKELTFTQILGSLGRDLPRLGRMRLSALELVDKLQTCYGLRMLEVFKEADLFSSLIKMYAFYPYNDMALRLVSNILSSALDDKLAKSMAQKAAPAKRPSRILELEPISQAEPEESTDATDSAADQEDKQ